MNYWLYHPNFRKRRAEVLAQTNNRCKRCGIKNRSFAINSEGEVYIVYLHVCHVFAGEKYLEDAELIPLCPTHHFYFDHPRGDTPEGRADWAFIGEVHREILVRQLVQTSDQQEKSA